MTSFDLFILTPSLLIAAAAVMVMLAISVHRHHGFVASLAVLGLSSSLVLTFRLYSLPDLPRFVTPLFFIDRYALLFTGLVLAASLAVALVSHAYFAIRSGRREEFSILLLTATLGAMALTASSHFASFFLGIETLTVSLYGMIAYSRDSRRGIEAGVKYLILAAVSSAFVLFGMALVYAGAGSLSYAGIAAAADNALLFAGLALIIAGAGFKLAVVPFHLWTPDVYEGAPAPVTAFIATVSKAAVFAALLRLLAALGLHSRPALLTGITAIAVISMFAGNLLALFQTNVKRLLAYSSIAHLGYLLVALLASGPDATTAAVLYLAAYIVTSLGAFGAIAALSGAERDADRIEDYRGLARKRPWTTAFLALMLLSLAGMPLTAGFIGKFYLVVTGVDAGLRVAVGSLVAGSVIGLFYYLRLIAAFFEPSPDNTAPLPLPLLSAGVLTVLALLLLWFGSYPGPMIGFVRTAMQVMTP